MDAQPYGHRWRAPLVASPRRVEGWLNAGCGRSHLCSNTTTPNSASHVGTLLANACVLRVRDASRSLKIPLSRSMWTVTGCSIGAPMAARVSSSNSRPCSSRCLMVCVRESPSGTRKGGRPGRPQRMAVGASDHLRVGPPAVGAPAHRLSPRAGMDLRDSLTPQGLLTSAAGVSETMKRLWRSTIIMQPHLSPRPGGSCAVSFRSFFGQTTRTRLYL